MFRNPNYILLSLALLFLISSDAASQFTDKPISEIERESRTSYFNRMKSDYRSDTNINAVYYKLNLTITYNPNFLKGDVTINSISRVNNLSSVFYDLSNNLNVDSIIYNNITLPFIHSQNKITISLNTNFNAGQEISLRIFYHGVPVSTGFGSFVFATHGFNEPVITTVSEPFGASDWYPCKNSPSDKADSSDMWLRCSAELTAVSNGLLKEILNNGDGTLTYKWHNAYPIANYVISLAISNYEQYNTYFKYSLNDSMPVMNYIYPEDMQKLKPQLDKTNQMLALFTQTYGPYPFLNEKYGHAQFGRLAGMENQTVSTMGVFNDDIIAHELAHQWFGDKITCFNWQNIWLNEGFATYGQAIYHEAFEGQTGYDDFIRNEMAFAKTAVGTIYVQDINSIAEIFSPSRSYAKGCVVLHMLRGVIGDTNFFNTLRAYTADTMFAYKTAVTENFQNVAETVSGQDLEYFFREWIYGENFPVYNISWTSGTISNNRYNVSVNLLQNVNTNPPYFTMPVQIEISMQAGDTVFTVFNNMQSQTFDFIVQSKPLDVTIDPDNLILKNVYGDNIVPVTFSLSQNYPNPFNPKTNIDYQIGKPSFVTLTVYGLLGNQIAVLVKEMQREGNYSVELITEGLASGVYFYILQASDSQYNNIFYENSGKMILVK